MPKGQARRAVFLLLKNAEMKIIERATMFGKQICWRMRKKNKFNIITATLSYLTKQIFLLNIMYRENIEGAINALFINSRFVA